MYEPGQRRVEGLVDRQPPGERAHQHRGEVEHERAGDPGPVDEVERMPDEVPLGPAPLEQHEHRDEEEEEEERDPGPQAARHEPHAAARSGARTAS